MALREPYKGYVLQADPVRRAGRWTHHEQHSDLPHDMTTTAAHVLLIELRRSFDAVTVDAVADRAGVDGEAVLAAARQLGMPSFERAGAAWIHLR